MNLLGVFIILCLLSSQSQKAHCGFAVLDRSGDGTSHEKTFCIISVFLPAVEKTSIFDFCVSPVQCCCHLFVMLWCTTFFVDMC